MPLVSLFKLLGTWQLLCNLALLAAAKTGQGRGWGAISGLERELWWAPQGDNDRDGRAGHLLLALLLTLPTPTLWPALSTDADETKAGNGKWRRKTRNEAG